MPIHYRLSGLRHARHELAFLSMKASYLRWRAMLKAGFNPNQPRVPAGNPDGGQWTSAGGGARSGGTGTSGRETVRRDETGTQPWHSIVTRRREDGSIAQETVFNRDGSAIRSEYPESPDEAGFDERHTVMGADGATVTFQNSGSTQTIFSEDGQVLSASAWTPSGPEPLATVQPAFAPAVGVVGAEAAAATVRLGLMLYGWCLSRKQPGQQPVVAFKAQDFQSGSEETGGVELSYVGSPSRDEVDEACKKLEEVQRRTDEAAETVRPRRNLLSAPQYGPRCIPSSRRLSTNCRIPTSGQRSPP